MSVEVPFSKYNSHLIKPGMKFGKVTVIRQCMQEGFSSNYPEKPSQWICICNCGKETKILRLDLLSGKRTACRACRYSDSVKAKLDNSFIVPLSELVNK